MGEKSLQNCYNMTMKKKKSVDGKWHKFLQCHSHRLFQMNGQIRHSIHRPCQYLPHPAAKLRVYNIPTNIKIILNQIMAYATPRNPAKNHKLCTKYCLLVGSSYLWRKRIFFASFGSFCFGPFIILPVNEHVSTANIIIDWDVKIITNSELRSQRRDGWWSANAFDLHSEGAKIEYWPENWLFWKFHRHPLSLHAYAAWYLD